MSDENGTLAFPKEIIKNDEYAIDKICQMIKSENISGIVIGESVDFKGIPNKIWQNAQYFIEDLEGKIEIPIRMQKEFLTTLEARRFMGSRERVDDSAAALILQRYLDQSKK